MKRIMIGFWLVVVVFGASLLYSQDTTAAAPATAVSTAKGEKAKTGKMSKQTTIDGEVVEVSCYLAHGDKGKGDDHKSCAEACAKNGSPLGVLTKEGKLYVSVLPDDHSTGPNAKLMDHIAHQVKVTG